MKYLIAIMFFSLFISSAIAQDRGTLECMPGTSIPIWTEPGGMAVARQVNCGRIVNILGMERGYLKIQFGEDLFGYVEQKYVRVSQIQTEIDRRVAELEAQVKALKQQAQTATTSETPLQPIHDVQVQANGEPLNVFNTPLAREPIRAESAETTVALISKSQLDTNKVQESLSAASQYRNVGQFWDKALKNKKIKLKASSKFHSVDHLVVFYNSYNVITASAIALGYPLRSLSEKETETITPNGELLIANVIANSGPLFARNLLRYVDGKAHLVLQIDGKTYQPVAMAPVTTSQMQQASVTSLESSSNYWGKWLGWTNSTYAVQHLPTTITLGFSFDIPPQDRMKPAHVILIDGEGSRYQSSFDLSKVWK